MTKPFSNRELIVRIKALLCRERLIREEISAEDAVQPEQTFTFGDLRIETSRREVTRKGKNIHLKPREHELLTFLAGHHGIVLSRDLTLERVWS